MKRLRVDVLFSHVVGVSEKEFLNFNVIRESSVTESTPKTQVENPTRVCVSKYVNTTGYFDDVYTTCYSKVVERGKVRLRLNHLR